MSRSGYSDDWDGDNLELGRYRAQVKSAIRGQRGQAFLKALASDMDAMPVKELIANELINEDGDCCTIGVWCKARGVDVSRVDPHDPEAVASAVGIARQLAAEIEYENDEHGFVFDKEANKMRPETRAETWTRMRKWVDRHIIKETV